MSDMENMDEKKKRQKRLILIIIAVVAAVVLFLLFGRGTNPDLKNATPEEAYAIGMTTLNEAANLSLTTVVHVEAVSTEGEEGSYDVELTVKLNRSGDDMKMESTNQFSNIINASVVGSSSLAEVSDEEGDSTTLAWYRDGWLYLQSQDDGYGSAREWSSSTIFNVYTFGRVILDDKYIISETIERTAGGFLVTRYPDPAAVADNKDSLLGSLANEFDDIAEYTDFVLTMKLDRSGAPVEFGMSVSWTADGSEGVSSWTISATSANISTRPVKVKFPPDDVLASFYGAPGGRNGGSDDAGSDEGAAQEAFVMSLLPPGSSIAKSEYDDIYPIAIDLSYAEAVAWLKENLSRPGVTDNTPDEYKRMNEMAADVLIFYGNKDGTEFMLSVLGPEEDFFVVVGEAAGQIMGQ